MARLQEAPSRKGMRAVNAWLPEDLHRALMMARVEDGIAMSEAIRRAVKSWLARRRRKGGRS
jgi:Arc/MetJ-type ribon-helix-helix transcriptional regulator